MKFNPLHGIITQPGRADKSAPTLISLRLIVASLLAHEGGGYYCFDGINDFALPGNSGAFQDF